MSLVLVFCALVYLPSNRHHHVNDSDFIKMINRANYGWKAGPSEQFDDLSLSDIKRMGSIAVSSKQLCPGMKVDVPRSFDVREKWPQCFNTPVYKQGNCSSSWAIQAASVLANRFCIGADDPETFAAFMLSPQHLLSCSKKNKGCGGGDLDKAFDFIRRNGLVTELCFPYEGNDTVACKRKCQQKSYSSSSQCVVEKAAGLKGEVFLNGPVVVPLLLFDDFLVYKEGLYRPAPTATQLMEPNRKGQSLLHAVKLLGWGLEESEEYWLIENSFGSEWGTNGVAKVRRIEREMQLAPGMVSRDHVIIEFGVSVTPKHTYDDDDGEE